MKVTKFDHPDLVGGIVWADYKLQWINDRIAKERSAERVEYAQDLRAEIERLRLLSAHLARGLNKVKTMPGNESAFIAAVFLEDAEKTYGLKIS